MAVPAAFRNRLNVPVIAAHMFLVSGPELVIGACQAGVAAALRPCTPAPGQLANGWDASARRSRPSTRPTA